MSRTLEGVRGEQKAQVSDMSCSINGKVKNIFLPPPEVRIGSAISSPLADEWLFRVVPRDCSRPSHRFTVLAATTPSDPETHKRYGCSVATMVLSETRGLVLFRVIRGGIGVTRRLDATGIVSSTGHCHTHPRTQASQEPTGHHQKRSPEMEGLFTRDAQAACDFSFLASKFSPFFHRVSVIAAILRASVRRAMVGLMPLASAAW